MYIWVLLYVIEFVSKLYAYDNWKKLECNHSSGAKIRKYKYSVLYFALVTCF